MIIIEMTKGLKKGENPVNTQKTVNALHLLIG